MKPALLTGLALDRATLTARATLEEPDVRLEADPGPVLVVEEAGARLELAFTDTDCLERFQQRVAGVRPDRT